MCIATKCIISRPYYCKRYTGMDNYSLDTSSRTLFMREGGRMSVHVTSNVELRNNVRLLLNIELRNYIISRQIVI